MVCLQPRPHANTGSRFSQVSAYVEEMEVLEDILRQCSPHGEEYLRMHQVERAALRAESCGTAEYAFCLALATNDGPMDYLEMKEVPNNGMLASVRHLAGRTLSCFDSFKPLSIDVAMARQLVARGTDWLRSLEMQIEMDLPVRVMVD